MASKLARLAAAASAYIARRVAAGFGRNQSPPSQPSGYKARLRKQAEEGRELGSPPPKSPTGNAPTGDDDDDYTPIQLLGRDEGYDEQGWAEFVSKMRQVNSSNVYAYGFQREDANKGILYVTFLNWTPREFGGDGSRSGPGPTYAYYDFPWSKYMAFQSAAASSAGGAVWDYCRVRHSMFEHQHTYRLIQTAGDYVPRKVTAKGYKERQVANIGIGKRGGHARQQLDAQPMAFRRVLPQKAYPPDYHAGPNRGKPNRGEPNRGR